MRQGLIAGQASLSHIASRQSARRTILWTKPTAGTQRQGTQYKFYSAVYPGRIPFMLHAPVFIWLSPVGEYYYA